MDRRKFMGALAGGAAAIAGAKMAGAVQYDTVIKNVKALVGNQFKLCDLGLTGEKIQTVAEPGTLSAARMIDGEGLHASPGWVDLHVHYVDWRHGKSAGSPASSLGASEGVTAMVDAGTTGAYNYNRLENSVGNDEQVPCYAFLSIKREGIKLTDFYRTRVGWDDIPAMERVIEQNQQRIVGLKLRADNQVSARSDRLYYVRKIREAGDLFNLPSMIHIGPPPPSIDDILDHLKEGDMITHFLRGQGHSIIGDNGRVRDAVNEAYARGVKFDLGHGMGSYSFETAERALDQGFADFTISSDLYIMSRPLYARTFANVLTNMMAVGMPIEDIMERASTRPAAFLGLEREIKQGAEATLTLFTLQSGEFTCMDVTRRKRTSDKRIIPEWTVMKGQLIRAGDRDRRLFI